MGNRVTPPPLYDLDYKTPEDGGFTPIYPEEDDYDYNNRKPWYVIKDPRVERVDETFGLDEDRIWYQCVTPTCDVLLHNYGSYLALKDKVSRYIFDETGKIVCDFDSVGVSLATYELIKPLTLKSGVTYYFPLANFNFVDEDRGISIIGAKARLKWDNIPEVLKDRTYRLYHFDSSDFMNPTTGKPYGVGDTISPMTMSSVTTNDIFYLEINKRIVVPDFADEEEYISISCD